MNKGEIVLVFSMLSVCCIRNQELIASEIDKSNFSRNLHFEVFYNLFNEDHPIQWQTYYCGVNPENNFDLVKDSTTLGEFYYKNIPCIDYSQTDSANNIDAFIAKFNNKNDDAWNTWYYEYYPEEIDLLDSSIYDLNLLREIGGNFTSKKIGTYQQLLPNNYDEITINKTSKLNEGINDPSNESIQNNDLIIFPNPFSNELNVRLNKTFTTKATINIFEISGKLVYFETADFISEKEIKINTEILAKGVYICWINIDNEFYNRKIVKE